MPSLIDIKTGKPVPFDEYGVAAAVGSGSHSFNPRETYRLRNRDGELIDVPGDIAQMVLDDQDYTYPTRAGRFAELEEAGKEEFYTSPRQKITAGAEGLVRGASAGLSDVVIGTERARERKHRNPVTATVTEIGGAVGGALIPGLGWTPSGQIAQRGAAFAKGGGIGKAAVAGAAEGAVWSGANYIGEAMLEDKDLSGEEFLSSVGMGIGVGGVIGGGLKALSKTAGAIKKIRMPAKKGGKDPSKWRTVVGDTPVSERATLHEMPARDVVPKSAATPKGVERAGRELDREWSNAKQFRGDIYEVAKKAEAAGDGRLLKQLEEYDEIGARVAKRIEAGEFPRTLSGRSQKTIDKARRSHSIISDLDELGVPHGELDAVVPYRAISNRERDRVAAIGKAAAGRKLSKKEAKLLQRKQTDVGRLFQAARNISDEAPRARGLVGANAEDVASEIVRKGKPAADDSFFGGGVAPKISTGGQREQAELARDAFGQPGYTPGPIERVPIGDVRVPSRQPGGVFTSAKHTPRTPSQRQADFHAESGEKLPLAYFGDDIEEIRKFEQAQIELGKAAKPHMDPEAAARLEASTRPLGKKSAAEPGLESLSGEPGFKGMLASVMAPGQGAGGQLGALGRRFMQWKLGNMALGGLGLHINPGLMGAIFAATKAAKHKDKIAGAVQSFANSSGTKRAAVPLASTALESPLFDEQPGEKSKANVKEKESRKAARLFKARAAELDAADADPEGVRRSVRRRFPVDDPELLSAMEAAEIRRLKYLHKSMPRDPGELNPLGLESTWTPSRNELNKFSMKVKIARNPTAILHSMQNGTVSMDEVEAIREMYPRIYQEMQREVLETIPELQKKLNFKQEVQLSTFMEVPVNKSMEPDFIKNSQADYAEQEEAPAGNAPSQTASKLGEQEELATNRRAMR